MKKILVFVIFAFILSGCATYKFKKSGPVGSQGYLVTYGDESIPEYTIGENKSLPDLELAKERFKRRRPKVEYYYKKMGLIESRLKEVFWDPAAMLVDFLGGILRWPFTARADYRYNHDPQYKARMDKLDEEKEVLENTYINSLKDKLDLYITQDLASESPEKKTAMLNPAVTLASETETIPVTQEALPQVPSQVSLQAAPLAKVIPPPVENKPVAIIMAKPAKGYSPLTVNFSGEKSYSKSGKIVAYEWDFGDGDTSTKKNPKNIYWSTTYGLRVFTVRLTVKDNQGSTSSATSVIEVSTR